MLERIIAATLCSFSRVLTGTRSLWETSPLEVKQRIYFANHASHADFVLIWTSLPQHLRRNTRPIAAADYWLQGRLRRFLARQVFNCVLIDRTQRLHEPNPVEQMSAALSAGDSLIIFPEGTRNLDDGLLPFKSGIYHLAKANPDVELMPVRMENLGRVLPKGALIPVPLLCTVRFGRPLQLAPQEEKSDFLARARNALLELAPPND
jgi:1-acyl-sn-glycerol-3-phosphate acyltransferase